MNVPDPDTVYTRAIAAELRAIRAKNKMSYAALEAASGITQQALGRYFRGERPLNVSQLRSIAHALGTTSAAITQAVDG